MRSLYDGMRRGRSFALCGGPKTGRTSTLHHVAHKIEERWTTYTQETKLVPVHLDLAEALSAGPDGFIPKLWTALVQALSAPRVCHESRPDFPRL
ncbi:hypothetical protein KAI87_17280, partial [Myxococcota bacterium]|nr:hypothetical protein [Myxococcota bacterium]